MATNPLISTPFSLMSARKSPRQSIHVKMDALGKNFLTAALRPAPARLSEFVHDFCRVDTCERSDSPSSSLTHMARIDAEILGGFFPTGEDVDIGLRVLAMIESTTLEKGRSLVEINQNRALAIENAQLNMLELRPQRLGEPHKRVMVVTGPTSMMIHKVLYATRSYLGPLIRHDRIAELDTEGNCVDVPVRIFQAPLLLVEMPPLDSPSAFYFAVRQAIDQIAHSQWVLWESRSRSRGGSHIQLLIRALSTLHVGAIAVVGINSTHAYSSWLPHFLSAVAAIANSGIGVVLSTTPAVLHRKGMASRLAMMSPEPPTEIVCYQPDYYHPLAEHYWALLDRTEAMPEELDQVIRAAKGQREWVKLIFREINRRLHASRKPLMDQVVRDAIATACENVKPYLQLWRDEPLDYYEAAAARDWIPNHAEIKPKPHSA
ncbi:hypothetical protein [Cupriavidus taiwanensis]|uniref:hypothetical protein n=1 Tax=Cupriavidus taiwanensis TaxID=164546 RepID=UPI000E125B22|nr:hypothetical protein [Cupriavidus taiwanensis]SOY70952.1 hypothetical protein CBM2585_B50172 [Cupriavidus taiwanensis]